MSPVRFAAWLVVLTVLVYVLIIGKNILLPLVTALSVWYLVYVIAEYFAKIRIKGRSLPRFVNLALSSVVIMGLMVLVIDLIEASVQDMIQVAPAYQQRLEDLVQKGMELAHLNELPSAAQIMDKVNIQPVAQEIGQGISSFAGNMILMLVYLIFIMAEQFVFDKKLRAIAPKNEKYKQIREIISRVDKSLKSYVLIKTGVSVLTGLASYLVMIAVGLEFAIFWAFLIFLLNFIPTLGSLVATLFPALLALMQFETLTPFLVILFGVGAIQFVVGNILEPRLMGSTLNVSGLVVILSLSVWGVIWGVVGMVLSVPIVVTLVIVLSQFPSTRGIAIMLSDKGTVADAARAE